MIAKIRILNQMGTRQRAEETFEYRPLSEELQVRYVRVRKKDGSVFNIEKDITQPEPRQKDRKPKYDLDERRVRIPGLEIGDSVEYDVVSVIRQPLGPGKFCVQHGFSPIGVLDEELDLDVPKDRKVIVKAVPGRDSWETTDGPRKVYHWRNHNADAPRVLAIPYVRGRTPDVQAARFFKLGGGWTLVLGPRKNPTLPIAGSQGKGRRTDDWFERRQPPDRSTV